MKRRSVRTLPTTLALFLVLAAASAVGAADSDLDERISLEVRDAALGQVLASFAGILGLEAEIDPECRGDVTIEVHNVRVATALTAACESAGCRWRLEGGRLLVTRDPESPAGAGAAPGGAEGSSPPALDTPIDMDLEDADLRQILRAFGSIAQAGVEIDDGLRGTVTVKLQHTPVREALNAVCRTHGCRWELVEAEGGPLLRFNLR